MRRPFSDQTNFALDAHATGGAVSVPATRLDAVAFASRSRVSSSMEAACGAMRSASTATGRRSVNASLGAASRPHQYGRRPCSAGAVMIAVLDGIELQHLLDPGDVGIVGPRTTFLEMARGARDDRDAAKLIDDVRRSPSPHEEDRLSHCLIRSRLTGFGCFYVPSCGHETEKPPFAAAFRSGRRD